MVQIILNGEKKEVADNTTIDKLLETMELPKFFVVEKNLKIIYKEDYINKGQNTLYLQKFDVVSQDGELYWHQYMQNLLAPQSEAANMKEIYEASNTVDTALNFIIPLYENMPDEVSER